MTLKLLSGGSKIDPRSRQNEAKIAPGGLPEATPRPQPNMVTFFAPFFRLLGGSWGSPGALLAAPGAVLAPLGPRAPGGHFRLPGVSFWNLLGLFFEAF